VKIDRIRVEAFGGLANFDTGPQSLGELVVVLGPNEAGKSTLFAFLTTALYGFHPASRENNPHVPWGGDEAAGQILVRLGTTECLDVERRLRSSPTGRLIRGGEITELRNQPVPWAAHVPGAVFGQVFAISLADLAGLDADMWGHIQDRIVGSMGSSDLGSARAAADALEREASEIWRPNRRGNQRLRALQEQMRELRTRRTAAVERDRRVRALVEERDNVEVRLRELRAERQGHRLTVERAQSLLPIKRRLARIESLRAEGGGADELEGLPDDPESALEGLHADHLRISQRLATVDAELLLPEETIARFDGAARDLLERGDEVARFLALAAEVSPERRWLRELTVEVDEIRMKLAAAGEHLLDGGWSDAHAEPVGAVSVELLRDRIARSRRARQERAGKPYIQGRKGPHPWVTPAAGAALLAGAAALAWTGLVSYSGPALLFGAIAATAGAVGLLLARALGTERDTRDPTSADGVSGGARRATQDIAAMVADLPVRPEYLRPPGEPLVSALSRLQELSRDERERLLSLASARERVAAADQAARAIASTLGRNGSPTAEDLAPALDRELREADRLRQAALSAERERGRLRRERDTVRRDLESVAERLDALRTALAVVGDGDPARGAEAAHRRLAAHRRADELVDELERGYADLPELVERLRSAERAGAPLSLDDREIAERRTRLEELDERVERLIAESQALERNAAHLREKEAVDAVDSELLTLQDAESRLMRERDRKWVLARVVREADRRFRETHQPDLIRRASAHLAHLTGGRYDRLLIDETRPDGPFRIMGPALPAPISLAPPVSTGTLEQAYLSLRLAIVDHLDEGHDRLPLFVDEALVNWDRARRDRGLDVLADLASVRQIFVFTCHPELASRLEERGARVVRLGRE
jgi:uncharacterized protein YhaN